MSYDVDLPGDASNAARVALEAIDAIVPVRGCVVVAFTDLGPIFGASGEVTGDDLDVASASIDDGRRYLWSEVNRHGKRVTLPQLQEVILDRWSDRQLLKVRRKGEQEQYERLNPMGCPCGRRFPDESALRAHQRREQHLLTVEEA